MSSHLASRAALSVVALSLTACAVSPLSFRQFQPPRTFPAPQPRLYPFEIAQGAIEAGQIQIGIAPVDAAAIDRVHAVVIWQLGNNQILARNFAGFASPLSALVGDWTLPAPLGFGNDAVVAIDGAGRATAVWRTTAGTLNNIVSRSVVPGQPWSGERIGSNRTDPVFSLRIAMAPSGNAFVVWRRGLVVTARRFETSSATGWVGAEEQISAAAPSCPGLNGVDQVRVAIDSSENAVAVWRSAGNVVGANRRIRFSVGMPPGRWDCAIPVTPMATTTLPSDVAMDGNGHAYAVWTTADMNQVTNVVVSRGAISQPDNQPWSPSAWVTEMPVSAPGASRPRIAADRDGNALAVWEDQSAGRSRIRGRRFEGGQWGATAFLDDGTRTSARWPAVAASASGKVLTTWVESDGLMNSWLVLKRFNGPPRTIFYVAGRQIVDPRIALHPTGLALVTWKEVASSQLGILKGVFVPDMG